MRLRPALLSGGVAAIVFAVLNWRGTALTPDSWAYWQGAVSLLEGRGYTYFGGEAIHAWPPLYSLYLAGWAWAFGPTGLALILATGAVLAIQAGLWCAVLLEMWREGAGNVGAGRAGAIALYVGTLVAVTSEAPLAHHLAYALLAPFVYACWRARRAGGAFTMWDASAAGIAAALALTHNAMLALVVTGAALVALGPGRPAPPRLLPAAAFAGAAVVFWIGVRWALGQDQSHAVGLGLAHYGPAAYARHLARGLVALVLPEGLGAPFPLRVALLAALTGGVAWLLFRGARGGPLRFLAAFFAGGLALTFVLFNVTWIHDPLMGRFLLFAAFLIAPPALLALTDARAFRLAVLALLIPLAWSLSARAYRHASLSPAAQGFPDSFLTPGARIDPDFVQSRPVRRGAGVLVSPPVYEWQRVPARRGNADG